MKILGLGNLKVGSLILPPSIESTRNPVERYVMKLVKALIRSSSK